jgi:hypothetical protein
MFRNGNLENTGLIDWSRRNSLGGKEIGVRVATMPILAEKGKFSSKLFSASHEGGPLTY